MRAEPGATPVTSPVVALTVATAALDVDHRTSGETTEPVTTLDPVRGAQLNNQGFALMGRGEFGAAVPILQEAVASWPEDSTDIDYAYALFNLGKSLNRAGRPDEAIPYLEKRLAWNDQRATVQAELDLAVSNAAAE